MSVSVQLVLTDAGRTYVAGGVTRTREVEVRVFAPDKPGDYPVIFWGHGFGASPAGAASSLPRLWADQGFIVVVPTHLDSADTLVKPSIGGPSQTTLHRVADMRFLLSSFDSLAQALNTAHPGYSGDMSHPIAAGHSHGAFVASLLTGAVSARPELAGTSDARFTAGVLVSPQGATGPNTQFGLYYNSPTDHSWTRVLVPTLILTGTDDNGTDNQTFEDRLNGFEYAPGGAKHAVVIRGANHSEMFSGTDPAVLQEVVSAAAAFSRAYARQDAASLATLTDTAAYSAAHPLVSEVYARVGGLETGALRGTSAADQLSGLQTADRIAGLGGDDQLSGGAGDDTLDGGAGSDTVSLASSPQGVIIDLAAQATFDGVNQDTLSSIENAIGSSFADQLWGDSGSNRLNGGAGADTLLGYGGDDILFGDADDDQLDGGAGDDVLEGGAGRDTLNGGAGADTVSLATSRQSVIVDLQAQATFDGVHQDNLSSIENAIGSAFADQLWGDAGDNVLEGGLGADVIHGGAGSDTVSLAGSAQGVIVDLVSQATFDGVNQDTLNSIENAIGSRFDDQLWGDDGANRLQGGAGADSLMGYGGADTLFGDAGDDRLIGGLGDDRMDGGAGFDVAIFQGSRASYTLTRNSDGSTTVAGGDGIDIVIGVEQLRFDGEQVTLVQAPAAGGMNPLPLTDGLLDLVCTDGPWVL